VLAFIETNKLNPSKYVCSRGAGYGKLPQTYPQADESRVVKSGTNTSVREVAWTDIKYKRKNQYE
jgi:hypothetical protein